MKINLKSNYDDFIKRIKQVPRVFADGMEEAVVNLVHKMCEEMKSQIQENRNVWYGEGGGLDAVDMVSNLGDDITYEIRKVGENSLTGIVYVGQHTSLLEMKDGRTVNPYLFIEFGYGVIGQDNPARYATENGWFYNINGHESAWFFTGIDGSSVRSSGRAGINFFYNTINKYRNEWKELVKESIKSHFDKRGSSNK